ncbi:MAG: bifunctional acetate--CoA ligase family protein/GNAT family N-acetyltransferase [Chloroflexota bacterium]
MTLIHPLDPIFRPQSVAVIGASEQPGSVGRMLMWNLISNAFGGTIYPVNPKRKSVLGVRAYATIAAVPDKVDLAVILTPAATVPDVVDECAAAGVKGVIVISAGFREVGTAGVALEQRVLTAARRGNIRLIGPNCLGVMNPATGLNATIASQTARRGSVGFVSQSGALCSSILDWSLRENVGFSAFVSIGNMIDVDWGDLIQYLGNDSSTKSIVMYMESIGNPRSFLSAAREVALTKPIIVIKPGRSEAAARAVVSHTGALVGSDEVLAAALRRVGVMRVNSIEDLFNMAEVLAKQPRPVGSNLTIVTNAGGPGALATDALVTAGGSMATLTEETKAALDKLLPRHWSHGNPIDIVGNADPTRFVETVKLAKQDENSHGVLVILSPQPQTNATETARALTAVYGKRSAAFRFGKPVLASWIGGEEVAEGKRILNEGNIPTFDFPDTAVRIFTYMWRFHRRLQSLYETPTLPAWTAEDESRHEKAAQLINDIRQTGRTLLTEYESKQVLAAYGIPTVPTLVAETAETAVSRAEEIGYPVVLKLNSQTITHKSDVGGVRLDLATADEVFHAFEMMQQSVTAKHSPADFLGVTVQPMFNLKEGFELIVGSSPDARFGPVLLFGSGGSLVEVYKDRALGLPPLTTTLARRMMERTLIYGALHGVRGRPAVDLAALETLLVRFSQLVVEQRWIKEIEINPLFALGDSLAALDARVVLYDQGVTEAELPRLAIRPYPSQYERPFTNKHGQTFLIRPIRPEDEPKMAEFHAHLSEESVYLRYFRVFPLAQRVDHDRLAPVVFVDYDRTIALVVEWQNPETGAVEIVGAGRLARGAVLEEAEFALLVRDDFHGHGLGTEMLARLLEFGRQEGIKRVIAYMLQTNTGMINVSKRLGFTFKTEDDVLKAELALATG